MQSLYTKQNYQKHVNACLIKKHIKHCLSFVVLFLFLVTTLTH